jgi:hypothetical protein
VPAVAVLWLEAANAAMHTAMALRGRRYNPGVATVALLMGPDAIVGALDHPLGTSHARAGAAAAAVGLSFAGLSLAMKLRMAATAPVSARRGGVPGGRRARGDQA